MKAATLLIPTHYNNGEEIPFEYRQIFLREIGRRGIGGYTIMPTAMGVWGDQQEGMTPILIAGDEQTIRNLASFAGGLFSQEAIFVLWHERSELI